MRNINLKILIFWSQLKNVKKITEMTLFKIENSKLKETENDPTDYLQTIW